LNGTGCPLRGACVIRVRDTSLAAAFKLQRSGEQYCKLTARYLFIRAERAVTVAGHETGLYCTRNRWACPMVRNDVIELRLRRRTCAAAWSRIVVAVRCRIFIVARRRHRGAAIARIAAAATARGAAAVA